MGRSDAFACGDFRRAHRWVRWGPTQRGSAGPPPRPWAPRPPGPRPGGSGPSGHTPPSAPGRSFCRERGVMGTAKKMVGVKNGGDGAGTRPPIPHPADLTKHPGPSTTESRKSGVVIRFCSSSTTNTWSWEPASRNEHRSICSDKIHYIHLWGFCTSVIK